MGYNVHDVLRKNIAYNIIKIKNVNFQFLVMTQKIYHFSRWNIEFVNNMYTLKNSYLFNNDYKKNDALRNI
jgi:hypothetical protein